MQRVNRSSAVASLPAAPAGGTPGYFGGGNPGIGQGATVPGYEWFNGVQEELIGMLTRAGITPAQADLTQLRQSLDRLYGGALRSVAANITLTADDAGLVLVDAAGGSRTITLPAANAASGRPQSFRLVRTDNSVNTVTIQRAGADTIEGATARALRPAERLTLMSDGVSAWRVAGGAGRLVNVQVFTASGTYTPTPGATRALVRGVGGGGAGGGVPATGAGASSAGAGGGAGAHGVRWIDGTLSSQAVTIGAGGTPAAGAAGGPGGTTSFGALLSCPGGFGGPAGSVLSSPGVASNAASGGGAPSGATFGDGGAPGGVSIVLASTSALSGGGASSMYGGGGTPAGSNATAGFNGNAGVGRGSGGGGGVAVQTGGPVQGGAGTAGLIIVEEYE
jgi:hypothetical protein